MRLIGQERQGKALQCTLQADESVSNLALLLPEGFNQLTVNGSSITLQRRFLDGKERNFVVLDLPAGVPTFLALTVGL